jgi:hypothetical protein
MGPDGAGSLEPGDDGGWLQWTLDSGSRLMQVSRPASKK